MHAAGFWHEQSRPDRDKHIKIDIEAVKTDSQYFLRPINEINMVGEYDVCSVMHYKDHFVPKHEHCSNCTDCDNCYNCDPLTFRGNWSERDVQKINLYYGCNEIGIHYLAPPLTV